MIKLHKPDLSHWGPITARAYDMPNRKLVEDLKAFYDNTLVPELVCAEAGPDRPHESWMQVEDRKAIVAFDRTHKIIGCWFLKDHGIYYACINVEKGASGCIPILRALAYKSFEIEGTQMWASTANPLIKAWATQAINTPEEGRPEGMPQPSFNENRVEWK